MYCECLRLPALDQVCQAQEIKVVVKSGPMCLCVISRDLEAALLRDMNA
jgi:hypothetical protein